MYLFLDKYDIIFIDLVYETAILFLIMVYHDDNDIYGFRFNLLNDIDFTF